MLFTGLIIVTKLFPHVVLLGYLGAVALLICTVSGIVITWQGLFHIRTSFFWRQVHLISAFATVVTALPHVLVLIPHLKKENKQAQARSYLVRTVWGTLACLVCMLILSLSFGKTEYKNEFPDDYVYLFGEDRPFAPSLATTDTGALLTPNPWPVPRVAALAGVMNKY